MARGLIAVLAVTVVTAGCGGGGRETVQFLVFGDPAELQAFREVASAFEDEQANVEVELIEAADRTDLLARLSTSLAGGVPPDVFLVNYRFYGQFAAKDVLAPVGDRLSSSTAFAEEDFYPEALDAFRWRGKLVCLPQNVSSLAVYWNRALFSRYGVAAPDPGWSWDDFVRTAEQLTRDSDGNVAAGVAEPELAPVRPVVYGLGVEPSLIRLAPFVWSNGGALVDGVHRPSTLVLGSDPDSLQALGAFLDLRARGIVPTEEEVEAEDDEARFANGRLGMLLSSRRATPTLRAIDGLDWDVAPLPVLKQATNVLHSDAYCIARASGHQDAAWRFLEFALGLEGQRVVARTGRTVPSLVEVASSDAFLDSTQPPASARVFLDAIPTLRRLPTISTWPEIEDVSAGILENGFYRGVPAEEVARQLDEATRPLFARGETP